MGGGGDRMLVMVTLTIFRFFLSDLHTIKCFTLQENNEMNYRLCKYFSRDKKILSDDRETYAQNGLHSSNQNKRFEGPDRSSIIYTVREEVNWRTTSYFGFALR